MAVLEFDKTPSLRDILPRGGRPGFDYALVTPDRVNDLKADTETNWDLIGGVPPISVRGKAAILMGCGAHIAGARPESTVPNFWVDEKLEEAPMVQRPPKLPAKD